MIINFFRKITEFAVYAGVAKIVCNEAVKGQIPKLAFPF